MNNKSYIGSSVDLKKNRLLRYSSMAINKALLKYGYSQFSLSILEYCEVDELMIKEKYYLNLLSPKYNILKEPGSPSREVIDLKLNTKTVYHAIRAAAKVLGIDKRYIENYINLNQIEPRTSHTVEVTDLVLSKVNIYPSVGSAARVLGVRQASISLYLKENRRNPFKNRYIFKLIIG
ncbi:hypothetical protein AOQ84DRAFT_428886 [Glonium stellatum]|uniref:GIY-YIG domain-containing protein n=1 Tax=Glonium stellatum TaxID=574774 RepID=A0A8E2JZ30_9PEZI|nr:hypothetical protein AOQ84DRAFT_428886 [Glonium stellatum]